MRIQFSRNVVTVLACAVMLAVAAPLNAGGPPQYSPWSGAEVVGPPISGGWELSPFIAKNNLDLYFVAYNRPGGQGGMDIWVSHRDSVDDPWEAPINLPINTEVAENNPFVTNDGHWLYFISARPGGFGAQDLWVSHRKDKRDDQGWEAPKNLGPLVNSSAGDFVPVLVEDAATGKLHLYFHTNRSGNGDLYVSSMVGDDHETFSPPVPVFELNTEYEDGYPFVRKDGLEIIFESTRPGSGTMGGADLWTAMRPDTSSLWSTPVPLGAGVNSTSHEYKPSISWDGTTLYFCSPRDGVMKVYKATRTELRD